MQGKWTGLQTSKDALEASEISQIDLGSSKSTRRLTEDARQDPDELLWESKFDLAEVTRLRKSLGPINASAQLDQNPVPLGGAMFKLSDFSNKWTEIPSDATWIVSADCSFEDEKTAINPDYVVLQVWAYKTPNFYLVDQIRKKMDVLETTKSILLLCGNYPKVTSVHVEKKANGAAVIRMLQDHIPGVKQYPTQGTPMPGKVARVNAILPLMSNVFYPSQEPSWFKDFVKELVTFPMCKNDDQVDCLSQALDVLHKPTYNKYLASLNNIGKLYR